MSAPTPGIVGANVARLRKAAGLSQDALARLAKLSRSAVVTLELGRRKNPDLDTVDRLARALGVTPEMLRQPHAERTSLRPYIDAFLDSPWNEAIAPTEAELLWLTSLPNIVFFGASPTAETVAQLIQWRRSTQV